MRHKFTELFRDDNPKSRKNIEKFDENKPKMLQDVVTLHFKNKETFKK
jgi:hypothetical protein